MRVIRTAKLRDGYAESEQCCERPEEDVADDAMVVDLSPYMDYKDSGLPWLGLVPGHWSVQRTKWRFRHRKELNSDGDHTNILSLTLRGVVNNDPDNPEGLVPKDYRTYQFFAKGDLVFKLIDLENLRTSRVGLVHEDGIMSSAYVRLVPSRPTNMRYFFHQYFDLYSRGVYNQLGAGVRSTLGPSDLLNVGIVIPPPDEQSAIVQFLDWANGRLERAIRAKRKVIALLNEQKQAIIHRTVTRGLDPSVPLKPSGIPWLDDIPQNWEVLPLKGVCAIQSGITLGKDYAGQALREYPYLRVANVQAGHVNLSLVKTIRVTKAEADRCLLQSGDVLMTEGGDLDKLGRGCVWNAQVSPCLHQNHVFAVRPNQSRLDPRFLSALMGTSYARAYFQSTAKQTTNLAATNKTKLGMFKVLLPGVDEQHRILARLDEELRPVNIATSRLEREIELLREYRTRLVADVVTGKLDVRDAATRLPDETLLDTVADDADLADETVTADEEAAV